MNKTFKNFDKIIDRYISIKLLNKAIDKELAIDTYIKKYTYFADIDSKNPSESFFKRIYKEYLVGQDIDRYFYNDKFIGYLLPQKTLDILVNKEIILNKGEKDIIGINDYPIKIEMYTEIQYKCNDKKFYKECFDIYKVLIFYLEAKKKLNQLNKKNQQINSQGLEDLLSNLHNNFNSYTYHIKIKTVP